MSARILLDECLPKRLKRDLVGHESRTAPEMGWAGKQNGDLLALAEAEFEVPPAPSALGPQWVQAMKLNYYADTDSLYIDLSERVSVESREISEGVVLDYDAAGNLVGIDIDNASTKVQMGTLLVNKLPVTVQTIAG